MKILMVVHSFVPEVFAGVEVHTYHLARILGRRHEVIVMAPGGGKEAPPFSFSPGAWGGVQALRLAVPRSVAAMEELEINPGVREAFSNLLDDFQPDLVHFHHQIHLSADLVEETLERGIASVATLHDYWYICCRVQLYVPGAGCCPGPSALRCAACFPIEDALISSLRRASWLPDRVTAAWRDLFFRSRMEWPPLIERYRRRIWRMQRALRSFDRLIANSRHLLMRHVEFGVRANRIDVIRYGLDLEKLKAIRHEPSADVRFGFIGSIVEHKGLEVLFDAFRRVPEATCRVWGDPEVNEAVRRYRESLNPPENVRFMGGFSYPDIDQVLRSIDLLIVPSLWEEAYGLTVDEAKAAGIPVLASRIGGIPEHLRQGKEGYLFPPGNARELERLIRRFAGRPDRVKAMRPSGEDVAGLEENAAAVERVYLAALARKRVRPD